MKAKFRGKIIGANSGHHELDWAYGSLVEELETGKCFICDLSHFNGDTLLKDVLMEVDPKTVGQYTIRKDVDGKEVYKGDVVKIEFNMAFMNWGLNEHIEEHGNTYEFIGEVKFYDGSWYVDNGEESYYLFQEIDPIYILDNVYDNPELLKKGVK